MFYLKIEGNPGASGEVSEERLAKILTLNFPDFDMAEIDMDTGDEQEFDYEGIEFSVKNFAPKESKESKKTTIAKTSATPKKPIATS